MQAIPIVSKDHQPAETAADLHLEEASETSSDTVRASSHASSPLSIKAAR